jgi:hypothetical protein
MPEGAFDTTLPEFCQRLNKELAEFGVEVSYSQLWSMAVSGRILAAKVAGGWLTCKDHIPRVVELLTPTSRMAVEAPAKPQPQPATRAPVKPRPRSRRGAAQAALANVED